MQHTRVTVSGRDAASPQNGPDARDSPCRKDGPERASAQITDRSCADDDDDDYATASHVKKR